MSKETFYVVSKQVDGRTVFYKGGKFEEQNRTKARHMTSVSADRIVSENPGSKKEPYVDPSTYYNQGLL